MSNVLAALRPSRPPASFSWSNAAKILAACEKVEPTASGALAVKTGGLNGTVFIQNGRICWIAAAGLDRRLSHLLRERSHALTSETLEDVYRWCIERGVPFGEGLVGSGMLTEAELKSALLQHSVESLLLLSNEQVDELAWAPRTAHHYDASFTFKPVELLGDVARTAHREAAQIGAEHLARMLRGGGAGAAFLSDEREGAHCVTLHNADWTVEAILELGRRVLIAQSLVDVVHERPRAFVLAQPHGASITVWRHRGIVFTSVGRDGAALSMKLSALEATLSILDTALSRTDG